MNYDFSIPESQWTEAMVQAYGKAKREAQLKRTPEGDAEYLALLNCHARKEVKAAEPVKPAKAKTEEVKADVKSN